VITSKFEMINGQRVLRPDLYRAARIRELRGEGQLAAQADEGIPRLFLPPGIGDIHWVVMKLRSFTVRHLGGQRPDVWLMEAGDRNRAADYVDRVGLCRYRGTYNPPWGGHLHMEMLYHSGIAREQDGFNWVLCANPHLERDGDFATWMPDCEIDWDYGVEERVGDAALSEQVVAQGPYVLASFFDGALYGEHYLPHFNVDRIAAMLRRVGERCRVLLTGASWDVPFLQTIANVSGASCELVGKTSCAQLLSLLRRCSGYVGHPAGNGIMAVHFRRPTVLLWSSARHRPPLFDSWVRPEDRGVRYLSVDVAQGVSADTVAAFLMERMA